MQERRKIQRSRTYKSGSITLDYGILDCLVRNVSSHGALIELQAVSPLPNRFSLISSQTWFDAIASLPGAKVCGLACGLPSPSTGLRLLVQPKITATYMTYNGGEFALSGFQPRS
jgi:hypothetical protein